jgi:hypothetical protein
MVVRCVFVWEGERMGILWMVQVGLTIIEIGLGRPCLFELKKG